MANYNKNHPIGTRHADFFIQDVAAVGLKARITREDVHPAQAIGDLEASGLKAGLLTRFRARTLEFQRVMDPKIDRERR